MAACSISRIPGAGRKRMFPELERELKEWVRNQKINALPITKDTIREKAQSLPNGEKFVSSNR